MYTSFDALGYLLSSYFLNSYLACEIEGNLTYVALIVLQNDIEVSYTCEAFYGDLTNQVASREV